MMTFHDKASGAIGEGFRNVLFLGALRKTDDRDLCRLGHRRQACKYRKVGPAAGVYIAEHQIRPIALKKVSRTIAACEGDTMSRLAQRSGIETRQERIGFHQKNVISSHTLLLNRVQYLFE